MKDLTVKKFKLVQFLAEYLHEAYCSCSCSRKITCAWKDEDYLYEAHGLKWTKPRHKQWYTAAKKIARRHNLNATDLRTFLILNEQRQEIQHAMDCIINPTTDTNQTLVKVTAIPEPVD